MFRFPRAVWLLGWVSLATDAATEAIYPLLPWQGIGAFAASALFGVLWKAFGAALALAATVLLALFVHATRDVRRMAARG
jgi:hypothetical protein